MSKPAPTPEMSLISESVANASARIRFFRIAFGAEGEQMVGRPEIMSILNDVYAGGRLSVAWGPLDGQMRGTLRLGFLALLCLETAMPYGGRIEVAQDGDRLVLNGHADKFILDETLWSRLSGRVQLEDLRPTHVQFGLLPAVASDEGRALSTGMTDSCVSITV